MKMLWLIGLFGCVNPKVYAQTSGWDAAIIRFHRNGTEQAYPSVDLDFSPKTVEKPAPRPLVPAWETEKLPFFCRIEHQMNRKTPLPVFFRLGSLEYVNSLEQKPGY
ncbi:MAG: hypothetical protein SFV52_05385 [Saprospiraceae bacterium]|nr:hypothetical protein [Saprospiraceae bacterium]